MLKFTRAVLAAACLWAVSAVGAQAQSACAYIIDGRVLTAAQWNFCFGAKQDALGFAPLNKNGDVMLGKLTTAPSINAGAGFNLSPGQAPTTPKDGDIWMTTSGLFYRYNSVTYGSVSSVGISAPADFTVSGSPVTLTGTLALAWATAPTGTGAVVRAAGPSISDPIVTGSFTATGLVTNADLANSSMTFGSTAVPLGGTLSAATARGANGFNVESLHTTGDANVTIAATTRVEQTTATFTAARTWTLPAANSVNPGQSVIVSDAFGAVNGSNTLTVQRAGSDTINGATSALMSTAHLQITFVSNGASAWTYNPGSTGGGGTVTSATVAAGTGISVSGTCTITVTGTCTVATNLSTVTNSLSGDVVLNNTASYFDGPSVAQGTSGTWCANGTVTLIDTAGASNFDAKLWDGTTVISSARANNFAAGGVTTITLSGCLATPAANLRISVKDASTTSGAIKFNLSGNSKDSTLTAFRIQ